MKGLTVSQIQSVLRAIPPADSFIGHCVNINVYDVPAASFKVVNHKPDEVKFREVTFIKIKKNGFFEWELN